MNKIIFTFLLLFANVVLANTVCIGNDNDQRVSSSRVVMPKVAISGVPSISPGEFVILKAEKIEIDVKGIPFFYWCTNSGRFLYNADSPDFSSVIFVAPDTPGSPINLYVKMGDSLGNIAVSNLSTVTTSQVVAMPNRFSGNMQITLGNVVNPSGVRVLVNNKPVAVSWSGRTTSFNLYQALGVSFEDFVQPAILKIIDANGSEIYSSCFPFRDVCPGHWYTHLVMKLWKEGVIQGYANGAAGIFGVQNLALRSELVAATVRAMKASDLPSSINSAPFRDVSINDWYAIPITYAKQKGLVQGCDTANNMFCPLKPISRAAAAKVVALGLRPTVTTAFKNGRTPVRLFDDVRNSNDWFYHYVYALQSVDAIQGYAPDGKLFKPGQNLTRAEMAKIICVAAYGASECIESGNKQKPIILGVTPKTATFGQAVALSVRGLFMPVPLNLSLPGCNAMAAIAGGTADRQQFTCTPSASGTLRGQVKDSAGKILFTFSLNVPEVCKPSVTAISPLQAVLNQNTTFTVQGACLPDTTAFWIGECANMAILPGGTETQRRYQCTPSYTSGVKEGVVKDRTGGNTLRDFSVNVSSNVVVAPPPSCTPSVTSVTPSSATLGTPVVFTVNGSCLPNTTAFWVDECASVTALSGGTETQRRFQCTPSYSHGYKNGMVKDRTGGNTLRDFSVNVSSNTVVAPPPSCTPSVTSVTPSSATLGTPVVFTVNGSCLPNTTAFWVDECASVTALSGGTETQRRFQCTPSYTSGVKEGVVKDKSGGTELRSFSVNVQACSHRVDSVSPLSARFNQATVFTVDGCLPDSTAFWIAECEGMTILSGGTMTQKQYRCTPSHSTGSKQGVVKDRSGGRTLRDFTLNVQR